MPTIFIGMFIMRYVRHRLVYSSCSSPAQLENIMEKTERTYINVTAALGRGRPEHTTHRHHCQFSKSLQSGKDSSGDAGDSARGERLAADRRNKELLKYNSANEVPNGSADRMTARSRIADCTAQRSAATSAASADMFSENSRNARSLPSYRCNGR